MARPVKWRRIENIPSVLSFSPGGEIAEDMEVNTLLLEEIEALRLKDLEGLEQEECALKMEVSRPTFQRILLSAREKVTDSLINGKAINIEGGNFMCTDCDPQRRTCGIDDNGLCRRHCRRRGQGRGHGGGQR